MKAIDQLVEEHGTIQLCLDHLAVAADRILANEGPPRRFFDETLVFCREFADRSHHYKEEHVMFGLLAQKHDGRIDGEVERHRSQHEHLRNLIAEIAGSLDGYEKGLDSATRLLQRTVKEYVDTLRSHIRSENEIFFPMVDEALTEEEDDLLMLEFEKYEAQIGRTVDAWSLDQIERIGTFL
jgi:hemerythrin-like domain-containing protein